MREDQHRENKQQHGPGNQRIGEISYQIHQVPRRLCGPTSLASVA
jgi:hypothetical protein